MSLPSPDLALFASLPASAPVSALVLLAADSPAGLAAPGLGASAPAFVVGFTRLPDSVWVGVLIVMVPRGSASFTVVETDGADGVTGASSGLVAAVAVVDFAGVEASGSTASSRGFAALAESAASATGPPMTAVGLTLFLIEALGGVHVTAEFGDHVGHRAVEAGGLAARPEGGARAVAAERSTIVCVRTNREANVDLHRRVWESVRAAT